MPGDVTREEFEALEQEVEGEKMVTRHILEQTRHNGDDLAAIKTRLDRVEGKVDGVESGTAGIGRKLDGLIRDLPRMIGNVMRDVLREERGKS